MLLLRSFRVFLRQLLGWEVPPILLLCLVWGLGGSTLHMQDPAGGQPAANPAGEQPSNVPSGASTSGLEQREDELALKNLEKRGGHLGEGQEIKPVRKTLEENFQVHNRTGQFELAQQMEREAERNLNKEESPATHVIFNAVRDHQSHVQDGRGGGKPFDSSNPEEKKTH